MTSIKCRDCGNLLAPDARGCSQCALNLEAEKMIDRFVLLAGAGLLVLVVIIVYFLYLRY